MSSMPASLEESTLVEAAIAGDPGALEQVLLAHYPRLEQRVRSRLPTSAAGLLDPEDVLQEALVDAFRAIGSFRSAGAGSFAAWLNAVVEHRLQDNLRRLRRKKRGGDAQRAAAPEGGHSSLADLVTLLSDRGGTPSHHAAQGEAIRAVQVGLAALPADQRAVIVHRYLQQQSIASTAAAMQRSPGAVRGLLHRAKHSLRDALGRSGRWFASRH
ncbi:MAG: RNA polymerase sigma factor [Pirellulales bacterium]|nr:RNA polymerase sigma factor [Pirellulales bacterium]